MAMIDNTLAAQVPTFDPATPLAQAGKLQAMEQENRASQFKQMQTEIGSLARGLQPFVNTPEFPARWADTADKMLQGGLMDQQTHQKWRNTPSPLLLKQMISSTEDPTLTFRKEEAGRDQRNTETRFGLERQRIAISNEGEVDAADDRAKAAIKYGLKPGTPEYTGYVLGGGLTATSPNKIEEDATARERLLVKRGQDTSTPQNQQFIATGKYPREDAQALSAGDKKAIMNAEDEEPALRGTLEALRTAKDLNDKTFTGLTAGMRGKIGTSGVPGANLLVDKDSAMATSEWGKVMSGEAIKTMADTLKGATTDFELKKFEAMLADPSTPPEIRGRMIDRMIKLGDRELELKQRRISELKGGTYFKPEGMARSSAAQTQGISEAEYAKLPKGAKFIAPDGSQRVKP